MAGLDEAGRGPLAGPVVSSAVILHHIHFDLPIDDSKILSPQAREAAYQAIVSSASIGVGLATPQEIDQVGIHLATHLSMLRALKRLPTLPALALIDGPWLPPRCPVPALSIVDGDARSLLIACASIVAKVTRDRLMLRLDRLWPQYGFLHNKGYGTPQHLKALRLVGPSPFHRFSFRPMKDFS